MNERQTSAEAPALEESSRLILGVGHPRTGTGYTAKLLTSWGLDVGHERLGKNGIVAWQLAVSTGPWPYLNGYEHSNYDVLVYNVRNPMDSIPSIVFTEDIKPASLTFRVHAGTERSTNRVEQAILSILRWDELISALEPDVIFRVEDQEPALFAYLTEAVGLPLTFRQHGIYNQRVHPDFGSLVEESGRVRPLVKEAINAYCQQHGYPMLFRS